LLFGFCRVFFEREWFLQLFWAAITVAEAAITVAAENAAAKDEELLDLFFGGICTVCIEFSYI
jgi:hypothetical protein